jgi:hypothetical protein
LDFYGTRKVGMNSCPHHLLLGSFIMQIRRYQADSHP